MQVGPQLQAVYDNKIKTFEREGERTQDNKINIVSVPSSSSLITSYMA